MKLIVGLGNPGKEYQNTRHNTGFLAIDILAKLLNVSFNSQDFQADIVKTKINGETVILMKPLTYMNNSGISVALATEYYHLDPSTDILIIYDDLDLPYGTLRLREQGSSGGHNGLKSIIEALKTQQFNRIRVGINKSEIIPVVDYVLGHIEKENIQVYNQSLEYAAKAAQEFLYLPFQEVMNKYNKVK